MRGSAAYVTVFELWDTSVLIASPGAATRRSQSEQNCTTASVVSAASSFRPLSAIAYCWRVVFSEWRCEVLLGRLRNAARQSL